MRRGPILGALLALLPSLSVADVAVPDTPAGHALNAFLDALNSGDRARQESFLKSYSSWMKLEGIAEWRAGTGGYDLLEVHSSDPTNVFFRVKQRSWNVEEGGRLQVSATGSALEALGLWRIPAGGKFEPVILDDAMRSKVVEFAAAAFESSYVDPVIGKKLAAALRARQERGEFREVAYGEDFAAKLTQSLLEISHDRHAAVRFSYSVTPAESSANPSGLEARRLASINCEFEKIEHLRPNVGYLKFNGFADPGICAATANAAMASLADSDALIIDLRDNRGGSADMALLILSYLFAERTHLSDTYSRKDGSTKETWTLPDVPGRKFIGKPVFVLTSKRTFSAAEAVSYFLKVLKRATVIGETTAGGGHMTETMVVDSHFVVRVPYARPISPITKAGWEGTGVEPDVKTPASDALEIARKLAEKSTGR